ncbi:iron-containing alcohol dehydrogenase [Pullulanibacillus sp. KACC 23026]|uniref:iron-containing alcohol dehydrogenase n=1 Tax=Pullulanibacillus sp. KACC 23026 TaxID=3028315 RepID=UPI0023B1A512|nr:iron-containing alcohol dehydrogenase [Pullulanibacillus sp. KACC 23026]WEG14868.1 iron-containing alcohol dehydrogenase [Pullulanibacillus sp. KACC 23026]
MAAFSLRVPGHIHYGEQAFQILGEEASKFGNKALIVSDHIMEKLGYVQESINLLENAGVTPFTFLGIESEPTDEYVKEALNRVKKHQVDVVIAVGGGSCIDTAKAVAVLATNGGSISEYMGNKRLVTQDSLPLIAVPTTAGTGSEATDVTVITNTSNDVKMMIKQPAFLPDVALVDPYLSATSPKGITASTGIDALTHAIEAYISKRAHAFTDTLAREAIQLIMGSLRQAYNHGEDLTARGNMAYGAMLAGAAFSNASVCLVHGMSRPIGALFHVPHGISNAMLLPAVLEYSKDHCKERLAEICSLLYPEMKKESDEISADYLVAEIKQLCSDLDIPNLKGWGIDQNAFENALNKMATDALQSGSPQNNPRVPNHEEIMELYQVCFDYDFTCKQKSIS